MMPVFHAKVNLRKPSKYRNRKVVKNGETFDIGGVATAKIDPEMRMPRKYRNTKCEWKGEKFDSKRELERHLVLLDMQKNNEICALSRQPRYALVVNNKHIGYYIGDWLYKVRPYWTVVVEDCKGFQTAEFKLKWKLAQALYPEIDWRLS